jgi:prefoldin subunit 1
MHVNKIETTKKIKILDVQIDTLKKQKQRYELTAKEVENLNEENSKVYSAVGRMFVISTMPEVKEDLKLKKAKVEKVVETCDKSKAILMNNIQEQEKSLRDLVEAKKNSK